MELTLYKMAPTGRINLTGLTSNRETYFSGEKDETTGVITLTPVKIVSASNRVSPIVEEGEDEPAMGETPWDE